MSSDRLSLIGRAKKWLKRIYYKIPRNDWNRYENRVESTHSLLFLLAIFRLTNLRRSFYNDIRWEVGNFVSRIRDRIDD